MSMNNLEGRFNELTNAVRDLYDRSLSPNEFDRLKNDVASSLIDALEAKNDEIKSRLNTFENFISSLNNTSKNPKVDVEITRILNDIEALHSKMNSQEIQTETLIRSFEALRNNSNQDQISKLSDEVSKITKYYNGIVDTLNANFHDFLKRLEATGSNKEELQEIRYFLESIEGSQNVLVSAMNSVNDSQEEIKKLVKQAIPGQGNERLEQLQGALSQMNKLLSETASMNTETKNALTAQLNSIIGKLEVIQFGGSSASEGDVTKLQASMNEFKEGVYSAISSQLKEVINSISAKFDKISTSLNLSDTATSLTSEVQRLNTNMVENLGSKTIEIRQELQQSSQLSTTNIINSIKSEFMNMSRSLSGINLISDNSNKDEQINSLSQKVDFILASLKGSDIINKIDELEEKINLDGIYMTLNSINQRIDFSSIEGTVTNLKDFLSNTNFSDEMRDIKEKLSTINSLGEELVSFKNIDLSLNEVKNRFEEAIKVNTTNIQGVVSTISANLNLVNSKIESAFANNASNLENALDVINDNVNSLGTQLSDTFKDNVSNLENNIGILSEKLNLLDTRINGTGDTRLDEIKESLTFLADLVRNIATSPINEQIEILQQSFVSANLENVKEMKGDLYNFKDALSEELDILKNYLIDIQSKNEHTDVLIPFFDELESRLSSKIVSLETVVEEGMDTGGKKLQVGLIKCMEAIKDDFRGLISVVLNEAITSKTEAIGDYIKAQISETRVEINNFLKQENEILANSLSDRVETYSQDFVGKISQIISQRDNSEARIAFIKSITDSLEAILDNSTASRNGWENANYTFKSVNDELNNINTNISELKYKIRDFAEASKADIEGKFELVSANNDIVQSKITEILLQNSSEFKEAINSVQNAVTSVISKLSEPRPKEDPELIDTLDDLNRCIGSTQHAIEDLIKESGANNDHLLSVAKSVENAADSVKNITTKRDLDEAINTVMTLIASTLPNNTKYDDFKSELKSMKNQISNIENALIKSNDGDPNNNYNIMDIGEDIAKIRIGLEKNNKLNNFKEFASRLVELKNINLENNKISRVIGADIMRVDGWLKNATAKMDLLAAKIEKSEKSKADDLKSRLSPGEKGSLTHSRLEETVVNIYKKYRTQEAKMEEILTKVETLSLRQSETFDIKEFIDLFYDSAKRQESILNKMSAMEDKMDLIQAKIDHIITSCIDD